MIPLVALLFAAAQSANEAPLDFIYAWPTAAAEDPRLRAALERDRVEARAEAERYVAEDRQSRPPEAGFNPHYYHQNWEVAGSAPQLLSLQASIETYTGGAHGNMHFEAILWDLADGRGIAGPELFGRAALERLGPRYCDALDAERAERRGEPVRRGSDDMFTDCPALAEQVMAPADEDGNGRFDSLRILLPPYAAGPYVEGDYIVELAFEPEDLAGIPDRFRPAFEVPGERSP
ncbi:MAG: PdaC/SigV domain-containing protein [Sphingosinicella sp.]|uniref:PdaC/SigV domain-containing protein n=1 Tax=Sphingosinicella sp. TaxID=1917971 RepID=UPI004037D9C9